MMSTKSTGIELLIPVLFVSFLYYLYSLNNIDFICILSLSAFNRMILLNNADKGDKKMKKRSMFFLSIILIFGTVAGFNSINHIRQKDTSNMENYDAKVSHNEELIDLVSKPDSRLRGITIVIDPGHGGGDRGTKGMYYGTIEKDLNLKVAQNIKKELEERTDAKVILTRETDTSLLPETNQKEELKARVKVASEHSADLYISIHHDAFEDTNVRGITTHYGANKRKDKKLAQMVQRGIFNQNIDARDRGVHASDFLVLRENESPSILIELGFMSNKSDEERANSDEFQKKSAKGIVDGIIDYFTS